jgi:hypothetical protein
MTLVVVDHRTQEIAFCRAETARGSNSARPWVAAPCGSRIMVRAGRGSPTHIHGDVEETITFFAGTTESWCDDERPWAQRCRFCCPLSWHGFTNVGDDELHALVIWSVASVPIEYLDTPDKIELAERVRLIRTIDQDEVARLSRIKFPLDAWLRAAIAWVSARGALAVCLWQQDRQLHLR